MAKLKGTYFLNKTEEGTGSGIRRELDRGRGAHSLETVERRSQDTERKQPSKGHSLSGDHRGGISQDMKKKRPGKKHSLSGDRRGRINTGHGKKATEREIITHWRPQRERQAVKKRNDGVWGTHELKITEE